MQVYGHDDRSGGKRRQDHLHRRAGEKIPRTGKTGASHHDDPHVSKGGYLEYERRSGNLRMLTNKGILYGRTARRAGR